MNKLSKTVLAVSLSVSMLSGVVGAEQTVRTPRSEPTPTTEVVRTNRNSSETDSRDTRVDEIETGEWQYEGDGLFDVLYLEIGYAAIQAEDVLEDVDPEQIAFETGMTYNGEDRNAPDGCRIFGFTGPMNIPIFFVLCVSGEYYMSAMTADYNLAIDTAESFVDGEMPAIPRGYDLVG